MRKKHLIVILFLVFVVLTFIANTFNSRFEFERVDTSIWNGVSKNHLEGNSEIDLLKNVLFFVGSEGDFGGTIKLERIPDGAVVITIRDEYVPDDSIGEQEYRITAKKQNGGKYKVTEFARRGSCWRYGSFIDGLLSTIVHPLWTKNSCL